MSLYYIFFISIFAYISLCRLAGIRNRCNYLLIPLISSVLFAGLRGNVGTDTYAYKTYFNNIFVEDYDVTFEPLFSIFATLIKLVWQEDQFFIFSLACLYGFLFYLILRRIYEKDLFLLFYLSSYYIFLNFNLLRTGIAVLLLAYAYLLYIDDKKYQWIYYISGYFTHYSSILISFVFIKSKYLIYYILMLITLISIGISFILHKLSAHFLSNALNMDEFKIGFGWFIEIFIIIYIFIKNKDKLSSRSIPLACVYVIFKFLGFAVSILDRVSLIAGVLMYIQFFNYRQTHAVKLAILFLIIYNLYRSLAFVSSSDAAMDKLIFELPGFSRSYSQTHWVPYVFFWEN